MCICFPSSDSSLRSSLLLTDPGRLPFLLHYLSSLFSRLSAAEQSSGKWLCCLRQTPQSVPSLCPRTPADMHSFSSSTWPPVPILRGGGVLVPLYLLQLVPSLVNSCHFLPTCSHFPSSRLPQLPPWTRRMYLKPTLGQVKFKASMSAIHFRPGGSPGLTISSQWCACSRSSQGQIACSFCTPGSRRWGLGRERLSCH